MRNMVLTFVAGVLVTLLIYSAFLKSIQSEQVPVEATLAVVPRAELERSGQVGDQSQSEVNIRPVDARPEARGVDVAGTSESVPGTSPLDANAMPDQPSARSESRVSLGKEIESEAVDAEWAPQTEEHLTAFVTTFLNEQAELDERYVLSGVRCRSTICEIRISVNESTSAGNAAMQQLVSLYDEPWAGQFDRRSMQLEGRSEGGFRETYIYLTTRATTDDRPP